MKTLRKLLSVIVGLGSGSATFAGLKVGDKAPGFVSQTHEGKDFDLTSRKGLWTVLYFYPKAETPGCTKQACSFRDSISAIRDLGAEVYGVSSDSVEGQRKFHEHHRLNFPLLADPESKIISAYGTKMPILGISKRHTFILDPNLVIRDINTNVDPAKDPLITAQKIKEFQAQK